MKNLVKRYVAAMIRDAKTEEGLTEENFKVLCSQTMCGQESQHCTVGNGLAEFAALYYTRTTGCINPSFLLNTPENPGALRAPGSSRNDASHVLPLERAVMGSM